MCAIHCGQLPPRVIAIWQSMAPQHFAIVSACHQRWARAKSLRLVPSGPPSLYPRASSKSSVDGDQALPSCAAFTPPSTMTFVTSLVLLPLLSLLETSIQKRHSVGKLPTLAQALHHPSSSYGHNALPSDVVTIHRPLPLLTRRSKRTTINHLPSLLASAMNHSSIIRWIAPVVGDSGIDSPGDGWAAPVGRAATNVVAQQHCQWS